MPVIEVDRTEFTWPLINGNQKDFIDKLTEELEKSNGSRVQLDQYEIRKTERQSRHVRQPTASPRLPRRSTEYPGWYKQMSSDMGTPRSITPILKKRNYIYMNDPVSYSTPSPTSDINYRPGSSSPLTHTGSYEIESDRSETPVRDRSQSLKRKEKNVSIGGVTKYESKENNQEYYPFRDAYHGKPLPGENSFMSNSWSYGLNHNEKREQDHANSPPPRLRTSQYPERWEKLPTPKLQSQSSSRMSSQSPSPFYRAYSVPYSSHQIKKVPRGYSNDLEQSGSLPDYLTRLRHIKVSVIPVPTPPKFGTLTQGGRWPNEAMGPIDTGPPCELCKKPINEPQIICHENCLYHCWHFTCSYCFKTLKQDDFRMAKNRKPYCLNCLKRQYP